MKRLIKKRITEIMTIIGMPSVYTAAAILIAYDSDDGLFQLGTFFVLLLIIVTRKRESRIPIVYALIMLLLCAFELAFRTENAANKSAILAYYLLCVGVITQFIEYMKNPEVDDNNDE